MDGLIGKKVVAWWWSGLHCFGHVKIFGGQVLIKRSKIHKIFVTCCTKKLHLVYKYLVVLQFYFRILRLPLDGIMVTSLKRHLVLCKFPQLYFFMAVCIERKTTLKTSEARRLIGVAAGVMPSQNSLQLWVRRKKVCNVQKVRFFSFTLSASFSHTHPHMHTHRDRPGQARDEHTSSDLWPVHSLHPCSPLLISA